MNVSLGAGHGPIGMFAEGDCCLPKIFGMVGLMDLERFGRIVYSRRMELGLSQEQVAEVGGPTDTTLGKIENGEWTPGNRLATLRKLDTGLQWEPGSAKRALNGGDPTPLEREPADDSAAPAFFEGMNVLEFHQAFVHEKWNQARDLAAAVNEIQDPPESLRDVARRIIFTLSGFVITRILESGHALELEGWLQRIYTEREQLFRDLTVGEPEFPWATDTFESYAAAARSAVSNFSRRSPQPEEKQDDLENAAQPAASTEGVKVEEAESRDDPKMTFGSGGNWPPENPRVDGDEEGEKRHQLP